MPRARACRLKGLFVNNKKFVPAAVLAGAVFAALMTPSANAVTQPEGPSAKVAAAPASAQDVERASLKCSSPSGAATNYSWGTGSSDSTTVYFNNHCSHKMDALLHFEAGGGQKTTRCMTTNGGTQGKKRFTVTRYHLKKITKGC